MAAIAGAVEALKDDDRIRWLFIGEGKAKPELERRIAACGARNVVLAGYQPREQLADVLDAGDAHLVAVLERLRADLGAVQPRAARGAEVLHRPAAVLGAHEGAVDAVDARRGEHELRALGVGAHDEGAMLGQRRAGAAGTRDLQHPASAQAVSSRGPSPSPSYSALPTRTQWAPRAIARS